MSNEKRNENKEKPVVQLTGKNGNVFNLLGICTRALKRHGQFDEAKALQNEVTSSGSYDEALQIMMKYCDVR